MPDIAGGRSKVALEARVLEYAWRASHAIAADAKTSASLEGVVWVAGRRHREEDEGRLEVVQDGVEVVDGVKTSVKWARYTAAPSYSPKRYR